ASCRTSRASASAMTISRPCWPTRPGSAPRATGSTGLPSRTPTSRALPEMDRSSRTGPGAYLRALVTSSLTTSWVTSTARADTARPSAASAARARNAAANPRALAIHAPSPSRAYVPAAPVTPASLASSGIGPIRSAFTHRSRRATTRAAPPHAPRPRGGRNRPGRGTRKVCQVPVTALRRRSSRGEVTFHPVGRGAAEQPPVVGPQEVVALVPQQEQPGLHAAFPGGPDELLGLPRRHVGVVLTVHRQDRCPQGVDAAHRGQGAQQLRVAFRVAVLVGGGLGDPGFGAGEEGREVGHAAHGDPGAED